MVKYIKCEAAISEIAKISNESDMPEDWHKGMSVAMSAVCRIPAADVVPVVRCKDCRKGIPDKISEHATAYSCYGIWHKPDWFCAGGVRKGGDGE